MGYGRGQGPAWQQDRGQGRGMGYGRGQGQAWQQGRGQGRGMGYGRGRMQYAPPSPAPVEEKEETAAPETNPEPAPEYPFE